MQGNQQHAQRVTARIDLDICTPEGKTWLARVTGHGGRYGLEREFINRASAVTSRTGRTGTATYVVADGLYESNEGRHTLGRHYWHVQDGVPVTVTLQQMIALLDAQPSEAREIIYGGRGGGAA